MSEIRTARLLLRSAKENDLAAIHTILSDTRAMIYWSSLPHETLAQTQDWLAGMIAIDPAEGEDFVVEYEGAVIGKAGLYRFPEIGFIFHPQVWGQGFAREALGAVIARAFAMHALPAIEADVDPRNAASLRLLTGLGFIETHRATNTWRIGEQWCDSVYLRLDASSAAPIPAR